MQGLGTGVSGLVEFLQNQTLASEVSRKPLAECFSFGLNSCSHIRLELHELLAESSIVNS